MNPTVTIGRSVNPPPVPGGAEGALTRLRSSSTRMRRWVDAHPWKALSYLVDELYPSPYFASGSNHPGEILGWAELGQPMGVNSQLCMIPASPARERCAEALMSLAATAIPIFVDSGAFSEVDKQLKVVKPITHEMWLRRMEWYQTLAGYLGPQLYLVAPDKVADQAGTLERLRRYAAPLRDMVERFQIRVIVPLQRGRRDKQGNLLPGQLDAVEMADTARDILGFDYVAGFPLMKAPMTDDEIIGFLQYRQPSRVHLLGKGPTAPRIPRILEIFADLAPETIISMDSVRQKSLVGWTKAPGGGPAPYTLTQRIVERSIQAREFAKGLRETPEYQTKIGTPKAYTTKTQRIRWAKWLDLDPGQAAQFIEHPNAFVQTRAPDGGIWLDAPRLRKELDAAWLFKGNTELITERKYRGILPLSRRMVNPPVCGDCYRYAYQRQREHGGVLVHGMIHSPYEWEIGRPYGHAWIEADGRVYDWQTMESNIPSQWKGQGIPRGVFYARFKPAQMTRYARGEALDAIAGSRGGRETGGLHYGPWEPLREDNPTYAEYEAEQKRVAAENAAAVARSQDYRNFNDPGPVSTPEDGRVWAQGGAYRAPLYHATLAGSAVMDTGLKAREDVGSTGLGAGPENTVSTTPSRESAHKIAAIFAALAEAETNPKGVKAWFDQHWVPLIPKAHGWAFDEIAAADARGPVVGVKERINKTSYLVGVEREDVRVPAIFGLPAAGALGDIGVVEAYGHVDIVLDDRGKISAGPGAGGGGSSGNTHVRRPSHRGGPVDHGDYFPARHQHLKTAAIAIDTGNPFEQGEIRFAPENLTVVGFEPVGDWREILMPRGRVPNIGSDEDYEVVGYRFVESPVKVGDSLPPSWDWDTGDRLVGTSAFDSLDHVREYASHSDGWVIKIGGTDQGWGELPHEMIIGDAEVLSVGWVGSRQSNPLGSRTWEGRPGENPPEDTAWLPGTETLYPLAGDVVDGRMVRDDIPNLDSIEASFEDPIELSGVREVSMRDFTLDEDPLGAYSTRRTRALADAIRASGEINPLIVGVDDQGPWIVEGAHRYDALKLLRAKSFPALVVLDGDHFDSDTRKPNPPEDTALARTAPSSPTRRCFEAGLIEGKVLDYGSGKGEDGRFLRSRGVSATDYDPYFHPKRPTGRYPWVQLVYVLNVLPPQERAKALRGAARYVAPGGALMAAVRPADDIAENARDGGWKKTADGYTTTRDTFQRGFTQSELTALLKRAGFVNVSYPVGGLVAVGRRKQ